MYTHLGHRFCAFYKKCALVHPLNLEQRTKINAHGEQQQHRSPWAVGQFLTASLCRTKGREFNIYLHCRSTTGATTALLLPRASSTTCTASATATTLGAASSIINSATTASANNVQCRSRCRHTQHNQRQRRTAVHPKQQQHHQHQQQQFQQQFSVTISSADAG